MKKKELREYIKNIISKKLSENSELTREGVVGGVMNHIKGILDKSNEKRFKANLEKIAADSPEGKKAVQALIKKIKNTDVAVKKADDLMKKYDFFS
jgi:hypothetical protein